MPVEISRKVYADMFGPTVGDHVRLADTELIIEVEKDLTNYGDEVKFGGGKVIRDGKIKKNLKPDEIILKGDNYKTEFILDDYNQQCEIVMQLTNEVDKFD